ncbi:MAG: shikimate kinase [Cyanophyceae cyanobacterium]
MKILVTGNSGAGKTTIAKKLVDDYSLAHLDLDELAWLPVEPPRRRLVADSLVEMVAFAGQHFGWVMEGCYGDLLEAIAPKATHLIWLNYPVDICIKHAQYRPWEPHKYSSPAAQDKNLQMLFDWIKSYPLRRDECSQHQHQELFDQFTGQKITIEHPDELDQLKLP